MTSAMLLNTPVQFQKAKICISWPKKYYSPYAPGIFSNKWKMKLLIIASTKIWKSDISSEGDHYGTVLDLQVQLYFYFKLRKILCHGYQKILSSLLPNFAFCYASPYLAYGFNARFFKKKNPSIFFPSSFHLFFVKSFLQRFFKETFIGKV